MITFLIIVVFGLFFFYTRSRLAKLEERISLVERRGIVAVSETHAAVTAEVQPGFSKPATPPEPVKPVVAHNESFASTLAKVGITILVLGVGFFLRYINSLGLIGPMMKYVIGLIAGLVMIIVAEKVRQKSARYANLVRGGGFILWFMTLFTGTVLYKIVSLPVTLTLIVLVLAVSIIISLKEKSETTFLVGIVGAYATPLIMGFFLKDQTVAVQLLSYVAVINIGVIIASLRQFWTKSILLSFVFSWLMFYLWSTDTLQIPWMTLWIFATIYGLQFLIIFVLGDIKRVIDKTSSQFGVILTATNTLIYTVVSYLLLDTTFLAPYLGFMIALLGLFHFGVYTYIRNKNTGTVNVAALTHFVIGVTLITGAIPVQFDGPVVTMVWFVEGIILSYLATAPDFRGKSLMYVLGFTGIVLGIIHMIFYGDFVDVFETGVAVFNQFYLVWLFVVLLTHAVAFIWKKNVSQDGTDPLFAAQIRKAAMLLMVIAQICFVGLTSREIEVYGGQKIRDIGEAHQQLYDDFKNYHGYEYYGYDSPTTEQQKQEMELQEAALTEQYETVSHAANLMQIIFFTLLTTVYLLFGLVGKNVVARRMGIVALVITIGQLFVYAWSIGPVYRIAAFVGLGIVLLVVSYLYVRQNKKPSGTLIACLLIALSAGSVQASAIEIKDWSTQSVIVAPTIVTTDNQGWYVAEIGADTLKASKRADFGDIRLVDKADMELPYVLIKQGVVTPLKDRLIETATNTKILENSLSAGERIVVLDTQKEGQAYTGIQLFKTADSENFRHIVHVYISDAPLSATSPAWRALEQKSVIYNYTDPSRFVVENLRVNFGTVSSRYIKLRFEQDTSLVNRGASFTSVARIIGARMTTENNSTAFGTHIKEYLAGNFVSTIKTNNTLKKSSVVENTKEKSTEIVYTPDGVSGLMYIQKITLAINDKNTNFKRNATVQIPDSKDASKWQTVATGQIYRIDSPIFKGESLSVDLSAPVTEKIRVIIQNNNDQPLSVEDDAVIERQQVGILFKKDDGDVAGLKLLIGNQNAYAPTYEIQKTLAYFDEVRPTTVMLTDSQVNPMYRATEVHIPFGEKHKSLISVALVLFVILIGYLGYRWSR